MAKPSKTGASDMNYQGMHNGKPVGKMKAKKKGKGKKGC